VLNHAGRGIRSLLDGLGDWMAWENREDLVEFGVELNCFAVEAELRCVLFALGR
jgi:hypothetical protein